MYQDFETDVMDDLFYEAAEGPARLSRRRRDAFDAYDEMEAYDEFSSPYTFFLLNGDMELDRNRQFLV